MLTIGAMGGGSVNYYTKIAAEDYYTKGQEPPGFWLGSGAEKLGLSGEVKEKEFKNIFQGFSADGKEKLVQNAGNMTGEKSRDPGWDLTFSAPKSASIVWAISDEETKKIIEWAHTEAVKSALAEIESSTVTRIGKGGKTLDRADLVIAAYQHSTSRAVSKNSFPDMNLHTHALILNVAVSKSDGKTRTIRSENFFENQMKYGILYRAEFSRRLNAAGIETVWKKDSFEIKGIDKNLISEFSKRTKQVEKQTEGIESAKEKERVKLRGRTVKDSYSREELREHWREKCKSISNFTPEKAKNLRSEQKPKETKSVDLEKKQAIESAVKKLVNEKEIFTKEDFQKIIREEILSKGLREKEVREAISEAFQNKKLLYAGKENGKSVYTNSEKLAERSLEKIAEIQAKQKEVEKKKFDSLKQFKDKTEKQGFDVIGCAFSRNKADRLEKETGIKSTTISQIQKQIEQEKKPKIQKLFGRKKDEPENKFIHEFKYATHQISKNKRDYLNSMLEKSNFKITEKTVLVIDEKPSFRNKTLINFIKEVEEKGGKVIYANDPAKQPIQFLIAQNLQEEIKRQQEQNQQSLQLNLNQ